MSEKTQEESILQKLSKIMEDKDFDYVKITPEGYGTFFRPDPTKNMLLLKAMDLKSKAEKIKTKEAIPFYLDSFFIFLKVNEETNAPESISYLKTIGFILDYIIQIIYFIKSINERSFLMSLEWAMFNLMFFKLTKESKFLLNSTNVDALKNSLKGLMSIDYFITKYSLQNVEIVKPGLIESGVRKRMSNDYSEL